MTEESFVVFHNGTREKLLYEAPTWEAAEAYRADQALHWQHCVLSKSLYLKLLENKS